MAPGVTVETDMKQAVMEEAAQVNMKYAVTLRPRYQDLPAAALVLLCLRPSSR